MNLHSFTVPARVREQKQREELLVEITEKGAVYQFEECLDETESNRNGK